jgi:hypothetical protein
MMHNLFLLADLFVADSEGLCCGVLAILRVEAAKLCSNPRQYISASNLHSVHPKRCCHFSVNTRCLGGQILAPNPMGGNAHEGVFSEYYPR